MPREGIQYHIDDLWRARFEERLVELGINAAQVCDESGCPPSMLSEMRSGKRDATTYLPEIHKVLKWPEPQGPLLTKDDEELLRIARGLDETQRARLTERALSLDEEAKKRR